jgi:adenosylcobinamide kinase / adenosylcobinamide-phosphate guanylyltransferase
MGKIVMPEAVMSELVLITGGARSGKSSLAEKRLLAEAADGETIAYLATSDRFGDEEFEARIRKHKERRDPRFVVWEESLYLSATIEKIFQKHRLVLLECITTWLGNIFFKMPPEDRENFARSELERVWALLECSGDRKMVMVSNELGLGLVPADEESRSYRDLHGRLNQRIAEKADEVLLVIAGIPLRIR